MNGPPYERLRNGHAHSAVIFAGDATRSPTPPSVILVAQALLAVCSRSVFRGWCRSGFDARRRGAARAGFSFAIDGAGAENGQRLRRQDIRLRALGRKIPDPQIVYRMNEIRLELSLEK